MTTDEALKAMAAPWTCCKCGREHWPRPDDGDSMSFGFLTAERRRSDGYVERYKAGEICRRCMGTLT
jgi:hypothetical protein